MHLIQISMFFYPLVGGQEQIVKHISDLCIRNRKKSIIIQPLNFYIIRNLRKFYKFQRDNNLIIICIPTATLLLNLYLRIFRKKNGIHNENFKCLAWNSFNLSLRYIFPVIALPFFKKTIISHYHFHVEPIRKYNPIVFSHGVEWSRPPKTNLDLMKVNGLKNLLLNEKYHEIRFIANDQDFINEICKFRSNIFPLYLPNPVDISRFFPSTPVDRKKTFKKVLLVRNVRVDRGIIEAICAFTTFVNLLKEEGWVMEIIGAYQKDDPYFLECLNSAALCRNGVIKFSGPMPNDNLQEMYDQSTITLVPSQSLEGTSLSALESMACGTPCVSTSVGGLADLPTLKSENKSSDALAVAMKSVLNNYQMIRSKQLKLVATSYSKEVWGKSLSDYLEFNCE